MSVDHRFMLRDLRIRMQRVALEIEAIEESQDYLPETLRCDIHNLAGHFAVIGPSAPTRRTKKGAR